MAESIAVGYRPTGFLNTLHKFIVYTDSSGNQWVTSAFPQTQRPGQPIDFLPSDLPGIKPYQTDWESLEIKGGTSDPRRYDSNYDDYPKNSDGTDKHPGKNIKFETVKTGENLKDDWDKIKAAMDEIGDEKRPYRPLENSNMAADRALRRAGIPLPKGDGFGENWAPGSGNNLPGGSGDAGGGGGGSGATAPGGIGGAGGAGGGGGRTESMEPGNTHWALMEWALESAEGTSLGTAAKRIRLDRRAQKTPNVDEYKDLQGYRQLGYKVLLLLQLKSGQGRSCDVLIPCQRFFSGLN